MSDHQELEQVSCPSCAGLSGLVNGCTTCNKRGVILQPIKPGHETLSKLRTRLSDPTDRYGTDPTNPRTGPKSSDPLWVGTEDH